MLSNLSGKLIKWHLIVLASFLTFHLPSSAMDGKKPEAFKFDPPSDFVFKYSALNLGEVVFGSPADTPKVVEAPKRPQFYKQPAIIFDKNQQSKLIADAKKGDRQAQDQLVELNYWGFLDTSVQCSFWGSADNSSARINILPWDNIERRAIDDDRYAYALIHSYEQVFRWATPKPIPFTDMFPNLRRSIRERAIAADSSAQFILGVMSMAISGFTTESLEWIQKAAAQQHSLAMCSLGLMAQQGRIDPRGRNDAESLRWYFASQDTKLSQDILRGGKLLTFDCQAIPQEVTFDQHIESIKFNLGALFGEHSLQIGAQDPRGGYLEQQFAIPELSENYKRVVELEEEAMKILLALQETTPGFMITAATLRERRDRAVMLSNQTHPAFVSVSVVNKAEFLNLGEKNVAIESQFLQYLSVIEERFLEADRILQEDSKSYQFRLNKYLSKLREKRLLCIHYTKVLAKEQNPTNADNLEEEKKEFFAQKKKYEDIAPILTDAFQKIDNERADLVEVKKQIQGLIVNGLASRNAEFFLKYPFLKR